MRMRKIKNILSILFCSVVFMLTLSGCGEIEITMTTGTANGKATTNGVLEYQGAYYIVDVNGINYKRNIDENSIVVAHSSKANGIVQSNFAVGDDKIYFITTKKGQAKTLYQCDLTGRNRKKMIVRDEITIVGVYKGSVYYYDEQNFLKCINAETGLKTEFSTAQGAPFYQYNNCFIYKASDGILEAYNCDDATSIALSEMPVSAFNTTGTGVAFAVNNSETKDSFDYAFSNFDYNNKVINKMAKADSSKAVDIITETVALTNFKDHLQVCDVTKGKNTDLSFKTEGKLVYNTAVSPNVYYVNDNTCLKFSAESAESQQIKVDYKKYGIDYNKIISVVNDQYIVSLDEEGYYSFDKMF